MTIHDHFGWSSDDRNARAFAPYEGDPSRRLTLAVLAKHGGYGARLAAPAAREVVEAKKFRAVMPIHDYLGWSSDDRNARAFAPYDGDLSKRLAFAVLVEHGGYGARVAAPVAREVMEAAKELGLL